MRHLLELGFDVNGSDACLGRLSLDMPLHHANQDRSTSKVKLPLGNGADPHLSVNGKVATREIAESRSPCMLAHEPKRVPEILRLVREAA